MKILIDLQSCQSGSRFGGIGRYSMALAKAMIRQGAEHEFLILINKKLPAEHEIRYQFRGLLPQHNILVFDIPANICEVYGDVGRTRLSELIRESFIAEVNPDVVHISSLIEGLGDDVVTSVGEIFPASRTAVTLYDLIPLVDSERYLTNPLTKNHYLRKIEQIRKAGMLFSISDYSRIEGIEVGGIPDEKIVNISSAVDETFKPKVVSKERQKELYQVHGISREFILFTGSFDSRKNHTGLVEAFGRLPEELRSGYQLVIVGNGWEGIYHQLREVGRSCGLKNDVLVFLGHISDLDLLDLYNICTLFVFPSLREGFGLPVLEAMSCGVPTIGSNATSIPEVIGFEGAMFDPTDVLSISNKIHQALVDQSFRSELRAHALSHSKNFSWNISARKALDFLKVKYDSLANTRSVDLCFEHDINLKIENFSYKKFISKAVESSEICNLSSEFLLKAANSLATNENIAQQYLYPDKTFINIGWITTWNAKCGVASYASHISKHTDCTLKIFAPIDQTLIEPDGPEVERCWKIGCDDFSLLNNSIEKSRVNVIAIQMNYGFYDFEYLSNLIIRQKKNGRIVTITLHATVDPPTHILDRKLRDLSCALNICDIVFVHSLEDIANLEKIGVTMNVSLFPQGVVMPNKSILLKKRKNEIFTIGTYGFFLPHKGLEQVIEAIARLRKKGIEINLEMINAEYPASVSSDHIQRCTELVVGLGLQDCVRMTTEYLDEQASLELLAGTDLVIFAYQGTGESSSAAVRMALAAGTLVAVTPLSIFNDVRDLVLTLPGITAEHIGNGILKTMTMLANNNSELTLLHENTGKWVSNHHFSHLARYFCNKVAEHKPALIDFQQHVVVDNS